MAQPAPSPSWSVPSLPGWADAAGWLGLLTATNVLSSGPPPITDLWWILVLLATPPLFGLAECLKAQHSGLQELSKACHGAGVLSLVAVLWVPRVGGWQHFMTGLAAHPTNLLTVIPAAALVWGSGWLLLNGPFAAQALRRPYRAIMAVRALMKLAAGYAAWVSARNPGWVVFILPMQALAVWCFATGGAKLALMLWGLRRERAQPLVTSDIAANEFNWDDGSIRR